MRVRVGGFTLDLAPLMDDQELDARASTGNVYWEGAVRASQDGKAVGAGYLELTGYGKALRL
jgi:predicted secreted hydrolase